MLKTLFSELTRVPARWRAGRDVQHAASLLEAGDPQAAASRLGRALERNPDSARAHAMMGIALHRLGHPGKALRALQRAGELDPANSAIQADRALLLREVGHLAQAEAVLRELLAGNPGDAGIANNLAVALADLGRLADARALLEPVVAAAPAMLEPRCTLARILLDQGETAAARSQFDAALARHPGNADAALARATLALSMGEFAQGWDGYAARCATLESPARGFPFPEWDLTTQPPRSLLVYAEQGIGDEIMFAGCYADVLAEVPRVLLECDPRLAAMLRRSFPRAQVFPDRGRGAHEWIGSAGQVDAQVAAGSLPRRYRRSGEAFPRHRGYLVADPQKTEHYRKRLAALGPGRKVGLSWRGGVAKTRRAVRSIEPDALRVILERDDSRFVCLQHDPAPADLAALAAIVGDRLQVWNDALSDIDETAALMCALDFTVSVCNYLAHLGGALGRDVRVMVPASPEWRYLRAGETMPWYPSVRLLRQEQGTGWEPVLRRVAASW